MACHPVDFFGWEPMPAVGAGDARRQRKPIVSTYFSRAHRVRPPPSKADRLPLGIGHGSDTLSEAPEANTMNNQIARRDRGVWTIALVATARMFMMETTYWHLSIGLSTLSFNRELRISANTKGLRA
jgi:hypothetical protein